MFVLLLGSLINVSSLSLAENIENDVVSINEVKKDVNNYNNGAIICVRDGYNTRLYARLETQWVYLNTALNTQQDEDVVNGYNESECVSAGFSPVSLDFNPIRVDDNLNIVRNDAHFKELLDNTLKDLGVINA